MFAMNILGIETTCDETASAVVRDGCEIISNVVVSSLKEHAEYGGIIPEIASRRQMECLSSVVNEALVRARLRINEIDGIAVSRAPGLVGSLLVGLSFARAMSYRRSIPLVEINHVQAHLYANFLREVGCSEVWRKPSLPAIGLVVSGGHTQLYRINNFHEFTLLGQTLDDAAGEAFDKVARILGLGYPGGPVIDRVAKDGENADLSFQAANLTGTYDFSFSGIKTAVLYYHQKNQASSHLQKARIAFSFQKGVITNLVLKSRFACKDQGISTLLVGGGVAANSELRRQLRVLIEQDNVDVRYPPMHLCVDNAAMIAGLGFHRLFDSVREVGDSVLV
jgi:N6-L-threonylcarbamoyladenine synthase